MNRRRIAKSIKTTIRKKLNPKNKRKRIVQEIKGSSSTLQVKKYFYKKVKKIDFSIYALTLNKIRIYKDLISQKERIYNWVTRILLDKIHFSESEKKITFVLDKSKSKPEIREFNSYIQSQLKSRIDPKIPLEIVHLDSVKDRCLQATDLFAWGIFRKYERRDFEWFNVYKGKVKIDEIYLP